MTSSSGSSGTSEGRKGDEEVAKEPDVVEEGGGEALSEDGLPTLAKRKANNDGDKSRSSDVGDATSTSAGDGVAQEEANRGEGGDESKDATPTTTAMATTVVTELPEDLQLRILSYLSAADLLRVHRVCQQWATLSDHGWLWQRLSKRLWGPKSARVCDTPLEHHPRRWKLLYLFGNPFCRENAVRWTVPNLNRTGGESSGLVSPTSFTTGPYQWRLTLSLIVALQNNNNNATTNDNNNNSNILLVLNVKLVNEDALPKEFQVRMRTEFTVYNHKTKTKNVKVSSDVVTFTNTNSSTNNNNVRDASGGVPSTKIDAREILDPHAHFLDVQSNLRIKGKVMLLDDHPLLKEQNVDALVSQLRGSATEKLMKTTFKVVTEEDFKAHTGFELTNYENAPSFSLYNCDTIEAFKRMARDRFGIPIEEQQYWVCVRRHNRTLRPDRIMSPELERWGVSDALSKIYKSGRYFVFIRRVHVEVRDVVPSADDFIVFFKYFDYEKQTLSYVGHTIFNTGMTLMEAMPFLRKLLGFSNSEELLVYEEVKPSLIDVTREKATFKQSELQNGDILLLQKAPPQTDRPSSSSVACRPSSVPRFLTVDAYLRFLYQRITVEFWPIDDQLHKPIVFDDMQREMKYSDVVRKLASHLGIEQYRIVLTQQSKIMKRPWGHPIVRARWSRLDQMLRIPEPFPAWLCGEFWKTEAFSGAFYYSIVDITPEDVAVVNSLIQMGFEKDIAIEAYLVSDRNKEQAVNYILESRYAATMTTDEDIVDNVTQVIANNWN